MHYKYKKIVTAGANGTTIVHHSTEDNPIMTLGNIDDYTYIYTLNLIEQHPDLTFEEVTLTVDELNILKEQRHIKHAKLNVRAKIRHLKDIEDDLVDQKQLLQFMARGFVAMWETTPQDIKDVNPYKDNFNAFSQIIKTGGFRLDLEPNQGIKIAKIINDEINFAEIVKNEYLEQIK